MDNCTNDWKQRQRACDGRKITASIDKRALLMFLAVVSLALSNWYRSSQIIVSSSACQNLEQEKPASKTTTTKKKKILWIATCETREDSEDFDFLYKTVAAFQARNNYDNSSAVDGDDGEITYHVAFKNVCTGLYWNGFMTKIEAMLRFASSLMELQYAQTLPSGPGPTVLNMMANSYRSSNWTARMDEIEQVD